MLIIRKLLVARKRERFRLNRRKKDFQRVAALLKLWRRQVHEKCVEKKTPK